MAIKAKQIGSKRIVAGRTQQFFSWRSILCTKVLGRKLLVGGPGKAILIQRNSFVNIPFISFGSSKSNTVSETISHSAENGLIGLSHNLTHPIFISSLMRFCWLSFQASFTTCCSQLLASTVADITWDSRIPGKKYISIWSLNTHDLHVDFNWRNAYLKLFTGKLKCFG